jgi:Domain of unknown function (DUF4386)
MNKEIAANNVTAKSSPLLQARIGGSLYLLIILGGLFAPFAVAPSGMMLAEPTLQSLGRIQASGQLYALGGVAQLVVYACDVGLALVFYELLKPVSKKIALLAAFFRLTFAAIASANIVNHFALSVLLSGSHSLDAFSPGQLQALALTSLKMRTLGFDIALFFFGFHCVIVGYLLYRSTYFPRILGVALAVGGLGYVANIFARVIPIFVEVHLFPYIMLPAGIAEIALTLWLLVRGLNVVRWSERASAS